LQIPQEKVNDSGRDEEDEHRLAHDFKSDGKNIAPFCGRKLVITFCHQPFGRFFL